MARAKKFEDMNIAELANAVEKRAFRSRRQLHDAADKLQELAPSLPTDNHRQMLSLIIGSIRSAADEIGGESI